ncbi:MAG: methyltransferase domain-containing protein [Thermoplasmata archaeon]
MNITRYFMYKRIGTVLQDLPCVGRVLGISGVGQLYAYFDQRNSELVDLHYPRVDAHSLPFRDGSFDWVLTDQVLEHIENPFQVVEESRRVLKPGGYAIHTSCLINPVHHAPKDYWRFTPDALAYLCRNFGETMECASWGNRVVVLLIAIRDAFRRVQIPERRGSLRRLLATWNEEEWAISTWVVARK